MPPAQTNNDMTRILAILLCLMSAPAFATDVTFASGERQIGLLELYTSEGCSSCPPADRWISQLKNCDRLWHDVIPLSFHVDYWDYIGWRDRFAEPAYSKRQRRYASEQSLSTVYTPAFVYNGREWRGWFERHYELLHSDATPGSLELTVNDATVHVSFSPNRKLGKLRVSVALVGAGLSTEVLAGENRGRRLRHDFVVLGLGQDSLQRADETWVGSVELPTTKTDAERYALVAWVTDGETQAPVQAVGGWLP